MRRAQIISISVALGAGALAFAGMRMLLDAAPRIIVHTERVAMAEVLVARSEMPLGHVASDSSFRWQEWPADAVSGTFITRTTRPSAPKDFAGAIVRVPLSAGEPLSDGKLMKVGAGGVLAALLAPGMRAISTKITEYTAAGKLILPNDRVDVILTRQLGGRPGNDKHVSETLLRNVRVLAIGQQIETKEGRKASEGNVATLELTPAQAEQLAEANSGGDISFALRSMADGLSGYDPSADSDLNSKHGAHSIPILRYGMKARVSSAN